MRILIRGSTAVVIHHLQDDEAPVDDPSVLRMIAEQDHQLQSQYADEYAFSHFVHDGSERGQAVAEALLPSGWVRLLFDETELKLDVETEYLTTRELTSDELSYLVHETLGQWNDGAGASAMDQFSESIAPYYVKLDDFTPDQVKVDQLPD